MNEPTLPTAEDLTRFVAALERLHEKLLALPELPVGRRKFSAEVNDHVFEVLITDLPPQRYVVIHVGNL